MASNSRVKKVSPVKTGSTLKMETIYSSKVLVDIYWTMWSYVPDNRILHGHCRENLKSNNPQY
jgi:hypothetical protein